MYLRRLSQSDRKYVGEVRFRLLKRLKNVGFPVTAVTVDEYTQMSVSECREHVQANEAELRRFQRSREGRFLGKSRSEVLTKWLAMDATLLGTNSDEIQFHGTLCALQEMSVRCCKAYVVGLRNFYNQQVNA
jgi:hypothetical protein